ncbi:C2 domain-containing protein [Trichostrongylus colubriformis]|uniref:C2 domain-containing protein n=1 Tax=Trichostrongylus colubriformis TaxID=6319 RepID=A0AAN8G4S9_TRICO
MKRQALKEGGTGPTRYEGAVARHKTGKAGDEFNTYVTVKLQNVKSTTAVVRGNIPCWEQEFIFETNRLDEGMIIELWSKGVLWDRLLGVHFMPLTDVRYCAAPGDGRWLQMDQELETRNGQTVGTSKPTGHNVLVDARFELPFA